MKVAMEAWTLEDVNVDAGWEMGKLSSTWRAAGMVTEFEWERKGATV